MFGLTEVLVLERIIPAVILVYTIATIRFKLDGRAPIAIALSLLVVSAVILAVGNEGLANNAAIVCYYFLVSGVVILFVEYLRGNKGKDSNFWMTHSVPEHKLREFLG